ncbi:hypothetical protein MRX96_032827 [Rhipicephalus microplus]
MQGRTAAAEFQRVLNRTAVMARGIQLFCSGRALREPGQMHAFGQRFSWRPHSVLVRNDVSNVIVEQIASLASLLLQAQLLVAMGVPVFPLLSQLRLSVVYLEFYVQYCSPSRAGRTDES